MSAPKSSNSDSDEKFAALLEDTDMPDAELIAMTAEDEERRRKAKRKFNAAAWNALYRH